jgi:hypothetical protein
MQLINLLTLGFLAAATVSAMPTADGGEGKTPACLLSGQVYNGAGKECKCPPGQAKKPNRGKCGYPGFPYPQCPYGEKAYCARSRNEYCGYGELTFRLSRAQTWQCADILFCRRPE